MSAIVKKGQKETKNQEIGGKHYSVHVTTFITSLTYMCVQGDYIEAAQTNLKIHLRATLTTQMHEKFKPPDTIATDSLSEKSKSCVTSILTKETFYFNNQMLNLLYRSTGCRFFTDEMIDGHNWPREIKVSVLSLFLNQKISYSNMKQNQEVL